MNASVGGRAADFVGRIARARQGGSTQPEREEAAVEEIESKGFGGGVQREY